MPDVQWFPQSKLNFAENLLRHGKGPLANEEAVITVSEGMGRKAWTFAELRRDAGRVQRALSKLGVTEKESCGAYIANVGEAVVAMLGATSTGATWTSCSPDFGARAVADRFGQVGPKVLFASDGACIGVHSFYSTPGTAGGRWRRRDHAPRRARRVARDRHDDAVDTVGAPRERLSHAGFVSMGKSTSTIDKVSELANSLPSVERVVVISSSGKEFDASEWPASIRDKVIGWEAFLDGGDADPVFTRVPFSHPQFVLYSSGTTGMPKSIAHGCGNTLLQHGKELILHGDFREGDKMLFYGRPIDEVARG